MKIDYLEEINNNEVSAYIQSTMMYTEYMRYMLHIKNILIYIFKNIIQRFIQYKN